MPSLIQLTAFYILRNFMAIIQKADCVGKRSYSLVYFMIQNCLEEFQRITSFYRTRVRSLAMLVTHWLTNWLTNCRLVNLIDVTLACEDTNSKLIEVVNVADVDDENRVGNSLLQIGSWGLVIKLNFCSDFEHKVWSRFSCCWCLVEVREAVKNYLADFFR